jgi:hypothetical protein
MMRWNDLSGGSIKTLLVLCLLAANFALALPQRRARTQPPGSVRASRAVFGAPAENFFVSRASSRKAFGEAPSGAREARAFPESLRP